MSIIRNYRYKVLQDMDLSQNIIYDPSLITNSGSLDIKSSKTTIYDLSKLNYIEITSTSTIISGVKAALESGIVEITNPLTVTIGNDTQSLTIIGNNKLKVQYNGRLSSVDSSYLNNFNIENGSLIESSQVNTYELNANDVYFDDTLTGRDIKMYWDESRKSLMFIKR